MPGDSADYSGITNPKRVVEKRERSAGVDAGDLPGPAKDMFSGPTMSQAEFSGYPKGGKSKAPPADMLKKHESK